MYDLHSKTCILDCPWTTIIDFSAIRWIPVFGNSDDCWRWSDNKKSWSLFDKTATKCQQQKSSTIRMIEKSSIVGFSFCLLAKIKLKNGPNFICSRNNHNWIQFWDILPLIQHRFFVLADAQFVNTFPLLISGSEKVLFHTTRLTPQINLSF